MISSAVEAGKWGMAAAQESMAQNADRASRFGKGEEDIVTPVVGMQMDSLQFKAAATVVREADKMQAEVLDLLA